MLLLAVLAWIFGMGSLALFAVFLWTGGLEVFDLRLTHQLELLLDALLCLAFFLQHSVLIRKSVRTAFQNLIPEHCYGIAYTISSGIVLSGLVLFWQHSSLSIYVLTGIGWWTTKVFLLLAFAGFIWGILSLKKFDAFGVDALFSRVRHQTNPTPVLTVKGPYRIMRHPFYAFSLIAIWATPVMSYDRLFFAILFTSWILLGTRLEERDLLAQFGDEYVRYRRSVPMFFPHLRRRTESLVVPKAPTDSHTA